MSFAHLSPTFFKVHPLEREFFQRFDGHYPWSESVFPIYAWDDLVYIAAADPETIKNSNKAWPSHWVLVKCEAEALATAWMEMREDQTHPRLEDPEMFEETSPPVMIPGQDITNPSLGSDSIPDISLPDIQPVAKKQAAAAKEVPAKEATPKAVVSAKPPGDFDPEQLFATPAKAGASSMDNDDPFAAFGSADSSDEETSENESEENSEAFAEIDGMPEGLELPKDFKVSDGAPLGIADKADVSDDLFAGLEASLPPIPEMPEEASAESEEVALEETSEEEVALDLSADFGSELPPIPTFEEEPEVAPEAPAPKVSAAQAAPKAMPKANPAPAVAAQKATPTPTAEPKEEVAFDEKSLSHFPKPMVISLLKQIPEDFTNLFFALKAGNSLRMTAWSDEFVPAVGAEMDFSLSTPSPFRIALRTEKSYHGYLVESPFLDGYFKSWSQGIYPANLSVVPVMVRDEIYGFLIAFGNGQSADRKHLSALEKKAIEASNLIAQASNVSQAS